MKNYWVYILCSKKNGTLYIGLTSKIQRRIYEHKNKIIKGFSQKYLVNQLVHAELFTSFDDAAQREKSIKKWNRKWKLRLIESVNPEWKDLYNTII